ncbi:hypothetical protein CMO94_00195 [Candidatus Woesearchaeota archaeon]|jgi:2-polyprenyl-3-methyl-5-hydroxy-6-metoxy-1,4-benzoquinol methylase|nr:hypothetical protein [Candidatus Woesearchaeota archaeon]
MNNKINSIAEKTISLYSGLGWKRLFAQIRFWDAPYKQVEKMITEKGIIIDLGCGEGLFSNYLALGSKKRKIFGIEIDKNRIKYADRGLPNTHFIFGDANKVSIPIADVIVLMHILHHVDSFKKQKELINLCWSRLRKGGKLIIVEVEPKFSLKYLIAFLTDHFLVAWIFERKIYSPIHFRKKKDWLNLLSQIGFKVNSYPAHKNKPFSHIIFECNKLDKI